MTGAITTNSTFDGRNVSVDGTKLDTIPVISTASTASFIAKGTNGVTDGYIQLNCEVNSHGIKLKSPPHSAGANYTLVFPNDDGGNGQVLTSNGSGVMSWTTVDLTALSGASLTSGIIPTARINASSIANDLLDSQHYAAGSIDAEHLAADIIDGTKIADNAINSEHYTDGSIDTAHFAAGSVDAAAMGANSVDSSELVDGSVDRSHLAADIVDGTKIADDAVNSEHIADGAIDLAHMSANSVDSDQYVDGSIDNAHLAADCVTGPKIATDAITGAKIADDAINSEHYVAGSIDAEHIADRNVTGTKIAHDLRTGGTTHDNYWGNTHDYIFCDADVGLRFYTANAEDMRLTDAGDLHVDGNITAYSTTVSDERLKTDITTVGNALEKVCSIRGVEFTRTKDGKRSAGVIAQELEVVLPQAITESALPYEADTETLYKTVDYDAIHALLIEAIKAQQVQIETLMDMVGE
jgi:hypothetical protein